MVEYAVVGDVGGRLEGARRSQRAIDAMDVVKVRRELALEEERAARALGQGDPVRGARLEDPTELAPEHPGRARIGALQDARRPPGNAPPRAWAPHPFLEGESGHAILLPW
jgi:hypothetical protein